MLLKRKGKTSCHADLSVMNELGGRDSSATKLLLEFLDSMLSLLCIQSSGWVNGARWHGGGGGDGLCGSHGEGGGCFTGSGNGGWKTRGGAHGRRNLIDCGRRSDGASWQSGGNSRDGGSWKDRKVSIQQGSLSLKWKGDRLDGKSVDGLLGTGEDVESIVVVLLLGLDEGLKLRNPLPGFKFVEVHDRGFHLLSCQLILMLAHDLSFFSQSQSQVVMLLGEVILALLLRFAGVRFHILFSVHGGNVQFMLHEFGVLDVGLVEVLQEPGHLGEVVAHKVGVKLSQLELQL